MDLRSITGSRVRAAILCALFGEDHGRHTIGDLATLAGATAPAVSREVGRLVSAGLVRTVPYRHSRRGPLYEADPALPAYAELRRFLLSATGTGAAIRDALRPIDPDQLTWIYGDHALGIVSRRLTLASISSRRREIGEGLAALRRDLGCWIMADVVGLPEWAQRVQRHELRAWAIRRAPRIWLIGDDERLRNAEHSEIAIQAARKELVVSWREEYEWDDEHDPSRVAIAPTR